MQSKYAYRWFLGLSMLDEIPNYSTWSQNYIRRYKESNVFDKIFEPILNQAIKYKFIDCETVFGNCKEQHNLRFTRIRGLLKNEHNVTMIFVYHNLKKMANWRWKSHISIKCCYLYFHLVCNCFLLLCYRSSLDLVKNQYYQVFHLEIYCLV